jgi:hypothetical protein
VIKNKEEKLEQVNAPVGGVQKKSVVDTHRRTSSVICSILKNTARSAGECEEVKVYLGTGNRDGSREGAGWINPLPSDAEGMLWKFFKKNTSLSTHFQTVRR